MLIPPDEHVLLLAERWLKLMSDLRHAPATLKAYRHALCHYFTFCLQNRIEPERPRLKPWLPTSALSCPACFFLRPAAYFYVKSIVNDIHQTITEIQAYFDLRVTSVICRKCGIQ